MLLFWDTITNTITEHYRALHKPLHKSRISSSKALHEHYASITSGLYYFHNKYIRRALPATQRWVCCANPRPACSAGRDPTTKALVACKASGSAQAETKSNYFASHAKRPGCSRREATRANPGRRENPHGFSVFKNAFIIEV